MKTANKYATTNMGMAFDEATVAFLNSRRLGTSGANKMTTSKRTLDFYKYDIERFFTHQRTKHPHYKFYNQITERDVVSYLQQIPMRPLCVVLLAALSMLAQDQPKGAPVTVLGVTRRLVMNGNADEVSIEYQNVSEKEVAVGVFEITRIDKLDRVTNVAVLEPVTLHESGRRTLRPSKKNKISFGPFLLHYDDRARVRVTIVKFVDGTKWEAEP
jgi:hypothetical protein